jgi:Zn-dependent protease
MAVKLRISAWAYFLWAFMVLILPARWWLGAFLAAAVHELCHLAVLTLKGEQVLGIEISALGACIQTGPMEPWTEILCAVAGPMGSFLVALLGPVFPEAAVCAAAQGIFNLLPVYPLDGGRILRRLLPESVFAGVEVASLTLLLGFGIWCGVTLGWGIGPSVPWITALMRLVNRKIPCKETKIAVQ